MAKLKFDGLIDAVRYAPDGQIELVRAYERRGATFSDNILINRANLVTRLKNGQKFVTGIRKEFLGSTFELARGVELTTDGNVVTTIGNPTDRSTKNHTPLQPSTSQNDQLEEVPDL
jgi:hypothetical protein